MDRLVLTAPVPGSIELGNPYGGVLLVIALLLTVGPLLSLVVRDAWVRWRGRVAALGAASLRAGAHRRAALGGR